MSYLKLILIILLNAVIISCGTESEFSKERFNWTSEGLENQEINALESTINKLFVASKTQLHSKEIDSENDWNTLEFHVNTDTSEIGDVLFHESTLFVVVRNIIEYHDLPNDYKSLYKSNDQGLSWEPIKINLQNREEPYVINRITNGVDNSLYADWHIIFKSSDNGTNWENLSEGQQIGVSEFLYVSKEHPNQIWTGGWNNVFAPYLAKSNDGGQSWQDLSNNLSINAETSVLTAKVHPKKEKESLIGIGGGVLKSEDAGESWNIMLEGYSITSIKNSKINSERVYASGRSPQGQLFVVISDDYGESWEVETYEESPGGIQTNDIVVTEVNGKETLYFGTNKGVYSLSFE